MTVDPAVVPGLLLLALEFGGLAAVGYVVARVALRQDDDAMALAQGMVIGPALWGLAANFVLHLVPGRAGALVTWLVLLASAAGLAWRMPRNLRVSPRVLAAVGLAGIAVFWIMLAARQLMQIADPAIHLGPAAFAQAGGWPLIVPWVPDQPLTYHYGADLLIGMLAPPEGPDLPFTTELLGAYIWTGFALVVATQLWRRGGWISLLVLVPLVLTPGAWTLVGFIIPPPDILQIPVPTGLPAAGLRASLVGLYWPDVSLQWQTEFEAAPPNIWKPPFVLAYALAFVVLEWSVSRRPRSWQAVLTLAVLVGFLGLLSEEIALLTLVVWGGLETTRVLQTSRLSAMQVRLRRWPFWRAYESGSTPSEERIQHGCHSSSRSASKEVDSHSVFWRGMVRATAGPTVAVILLVAGGGPVAVLLSGGSLGASLGWLEDPANRLPFGTLLTKFPGGIGILGLGVVPVMTVALVLAPRQRLVQALVVGSGVFMLAALRLEYQVFQFDVTRMDGHARNFALFALLVALGGRLASLSPRWRYVVGTIALVLITWPTIASPVRTLGLAALRGIELTNHIPETVARKVEFESPREPAGMGRYLSKRVVSVSVARYIQRNTAVDARILSPHPHEMTAATGRPNASGFVGYMHLLPRTGPEYEDAVRYLEPAAIRRLGVSYIHAPNQWVNDLPDRAQHWLHNPHLFELVIRGEVDVLYRIRPSFLRLDPIPAPQSFEALRQAVPDSSWVYIPAASHPLTAIRMASVLAHGQLLGEVAPSEIYLLTGIQSEPPSGRMPDIGVLPRNRLFGFTVSGYSPIWWNMESVAYAAESFIAPSVDPPPRAEENFFVRLSDIRSTDEYVTFNATFIDHASGQWSGQDWLLIEVEDTPWTLPTNYESDGHTHIGRLWFAGQIAPGGSTAIHAYEFNANSRILKVRLVDGAFADIPSSGPELEEGVYVLAVRLLDGYSETAIIPVLSVLVSKNGDLTYRVSEGERGAAVGACSKLPGDSNCVENDQRQP